MIERDEDLELELNDLLTEQDDHYEGNEFGFLDRKKVRNVFVAS
tara:strand:+ start:2031 stop:2162 length:132 start_codon:yes stop_codon:yes gene_type:complete